MAFWRGWHEDEVRNPQTSTGTPYVSNTSPGFTAINTSAGTKSVSRDQNRVNLISLESDEPAGEVETVASVYLGRGESSMPPLAIAQPSKALSGRGTKKALKGGTKRVSTSTAQTTYKRQKVNNAADDCYRATLTKAEGLTYPVCKPNEDATLARGKVKPASTAPRQGATFQQLEAKAYRDAVAFNRVAQPISIVAPSTSMDALQSLSHQTSIDAVKSSTASGTRSYYRANADDYETRSFLGSSHEGSIPSNDTVDSFEVQNENAYKAYLTSASRVAHENSHGCSASSPSKSNVGSRAQAGGSISAVKVANFDRAEVAVMRSTPTMLGTDMRKKRDDSFIDSDDDDIAQLVDLVDSAERKSDNVDEPEWNTISKQHPRPFACEDLHIPRSETHQDESSSTILSRNDEFLELNSEDEAEIAGLTEMQKAATHAQSPTSSPRERQLNRRNVHAHEGYGDALLSKAEVELLDQLRSSNDPNITPIARRPFPRSIIDRSPVFGASSHTVLRTCFRIGEAIRVGSQAIRENKNAVLELYARVSSSWREHPTTVPRSRSRKQHFLFKDLYHDHPPHLGGCFELWDQSRLWELDSDAFLMPRSGGIICRAIAKMKRDGHTWRLEVLSIWEAEWDDVEYVAGIYDQHAHFADGA